MKIDQQRVGTVDVLAPTGALVDEDGQQFCDVLLEHVQSSSPRVVINMGEVPYLDSTALEGLLAAADDLAQRAASLKLVGTTPTCRETFELTGLAGKFRFFQSVHDAVKSFL
ncbi:MAG: STAS domain-containing protein [Planctomycetes bacterium]|nr:STAS domain-containing protein [Planctomycetota bacterium]